MESAVRFTNALGEVDNSFAEALHNPKLWLDANARQLANVLQDLPIFSKEQLSSLTDARTVYPRFLAYTLAYIKLCSASDKSSLLSCIDSKQLEWSGKDDEALLVDHRSVRDTLLDILTRCDHVDVSSNVPVAFRLRKLLRLDVMCIAARTLEILYDLPRKELLLSQQGTAAQALLNHFQWLLDVPVLGTQIRSPILTAVSLLTQSSGLYPNCLDLKDVVVQDSNPTCGGSYGDVYRGCLGSRKVAVKFMRIFRSSDTSCAIKHFSKEAVLWRQLFHPNVLPFYGVYQLSDTSLPRIAIISPWMENGTIVEYVNMSPQADRPSLLLDIARGLEYLHTFNPSVVHGDLKGTNILITPSLGACIADFGLCSLMYDSAIQCSPTSGAFRLGATSYQAPELLMDEEDGKRQPKKPPCDIFSFGCVAYEIFCGWHRQPAAAIGNRRMLRPASDECRRVGLDDTTWEMISRCCQRDASLRPTAENLVQTLSAQLVARGLEVPDRRWDEAVIQCRATLLEDRRSTEIFTNSSSEEHVDVQSAPTLPNEQTLTVSYLTCESFTSLQSSLRLIKGKDIIVAVMGPIGTGKSTFINIASGQESVLVGHSLSSGTQGVCAVSCPYPDDSGRNIVFLDTPGFDDTDRSDFDILQDIATWLKRTYESQITLTGILYFHSISEARMRGTPLRNLSMFQELVGQDALQNVILTTTMWSEVTTEEGSTREQQLQQKFWLPMTEHGCRMARFDDTKESAWNLIGMFDDVAPRSVKLQRELVDEGKKLERTSAYAVLVRWLDQAVNKVKDIFVGKGKTRPTTPNVPHLPSGTNRASDDTASERGQIPKNRPTAGNLYQPSLSSDHIVDSSSSVSLQKKKKRFLRAGKAKLP